MNAKVEEQASGLDTAKLVLAAVLLIGAIGAFYYFEAHSLLLRVLGLLVVAGVAVAVASQTAVGRRSWAFISDANMEVRKVVWPTRQETLQTTLVVIVMVILMGLLLWLFDMLLLTIVRALTGKGG